MDVGTATIIQGNALALPLADESVDLVITSPPYFALRSYRDGDEHYDGQIGSEDTPAQFLDALIAATAEMVRVLKPSGSIWVNLGDKFAGSGGAGNGQSVHQSERGSPTRYTQASDGIRAKSRMLLPHRYAIRCIDELGLICRMDMVWSKPNGLPESVTDRVRASHEYWFHFVKEPRYFAAMDEIRTPHKQPANGATFGGTGTQAAEGSSGERRYGQNTYDELNPLGALPRSVWEIPTEPLQVPDHLNVDHFAAFPQEWPRRLILGWSPSGICTVCNEGRTPTVEKELIGGSPFAGRDYRRLANGPTGGPERPKPGGTNEATITGYSCACDEPTAPTRPAVILDPFGGTGTTAGVAKALGRHGISVDMSADYCRLATWRTQESGHFDKSIQRSWAARQGTLI